MTVGKLWSITLDCAQPAELAAFWAGMLGGEVAYTSDQFVGVSTPGGVWVGAYVVPDYTRPQWSAESSTKQFHLDLTVDDLDTAEAAALDLGAVKADHQPEPERWRVLFDPAGHPFCLTAQST